MALFHKILVANRGEIACRIIRTAKKLGIKTVAVFSEIDAGAMHVELADEAYYIGPSQSILSYLDQHKIIEVAKLTHAQAIHPGYGFLAENASFTDLCKKNQLVFIGPSSDAMRTLGEKHLAKELMKNNDIPVLEDYYSENQSVDDLSKAAKKMGFPLLIKAVAGGGGKGLRLVSEVNEFEDSLAAAKREAKASFNDDRVLLEKYLTKCKHIEVQIMADQHGNTVHLFERDCSIQRKHQKIIEEAPATHISLEVKQKLYQAAIRAAKSVNYLNAGTVEFLVSQDKYFFMEMNTRLQVEHPITEMITGIDIVEWQIRVAAKEKLPITDQSKITYVGHAIEARINAEEPNKNYIPASGTLSYFKLPSPSESIRIDTGYGEDNFVSIYYDSLLAKLIVHGKNRDLVLNQLKQALNAIEIAGITTNLSLLKNIIQNEIYQSGLFTTQFLEINTELFKQASSFLDQAIIMASLTMQSLEKLRIENTQQYRENPDSPWFLRNAWQLNSVASQNLQFVFDDKEISATLIHHPHALEYRIHDQVYLVQLINVQMQNKILAINLEINQEFYSANTLILKDKCYVFLKDELYLLRMISQSSQDFTEQESLSHLLAPMPGTLVEIMVQEGQKVTKGDKLLVIEAMKMEHIIYAPYDGLVEKLHYKIGDSINEGSLLLELTLPEETTQFSE